MANFHRLIVLALLAFSVFLSVAPAQAQESLPPTSGFLTGGAYFNSVKANSCQAWGDARLAANPGWPRPCSILMGGAGEVQCNVNCLHPLYGYYVNYSNAPITTTTSCPANTTLSNGSCFPNSGYEIWNSTVVPVCGPLGRNQTTGECITDACNHLAGQVTPSATMELAFSKLTAQQIAALIGTSATGSADLGGGLVCGVTGTVQSCLSTQTQTFCFVTGGTFTGNTLQPSISVPAAAEPICPPGQVPGDVNGNTVCYQPAGGTTNTTETETSTVTDAQGTATTNTTTTTTQTVCDGSNCVQTTTKTTTDGQGQTVGTESTSSTLPQKTFCEKNPNHEQCKGATPGAFEGSCLEGFTCQGDPVQCAAARVQHDAYCLQLQDRETNPFSELFGDSQDIVGSGGSIVDTDTIALPGVNQTDLIGGGTCALDKTITVWGNSITLPISQICPYLQAFGNLLVAVSLIAAIRIVGRG